MIITISKKKYMGSYVACKLFVEAVHSYLWKYNITKLHTMIMHQLTLRCTFKTFQQKISSSGRFLYILSDCSVFSRTIKVKAWTLRVVKNIQQSPFSHLQFIPKLHFWNDVATNLANVCKMWWKLLWRDDTSKDNFFTKFV